MTKFVSKLYSFVLGKRYTKFCISHCFFIFNETCQLMSQNSLTVLNIDVQTLTPLPKVIQKYKLFVPSIFNLTTRYHIKTERRENDFTSRICWYLQTEFSLSRDIFVYSIEGIEETAILLGKKTMKENSFVNFCNLTPSSYKYKC